MKNKNTKGFILMEAIIATGVLITIFVAAISLHTASVKGVRMTNDQLIATFLAQDAMEYVIAKRQYNFINDLDWLNGMDNCTNSSPCNVNFDDDITQPLNSCSTDCSLMLSGDEYKRDDSTGTATQFSRFITVETLGPGGGITPFEARVTVKVEWKDGVNTNEYKLIHYLYDDA